MTTTYEINSFINILFDEMKDQLPSNIIVYFPKQSCVIYSALLDVMKTHMMLYSHTDYVLSSPTFAQVVEFTYQQLKTYFLTTHYVLVSDRTEDEAHRRWNTKFLLSPEESQHYYAMVHRSVQSAVLSWPRELKTKF